MRPGVPRRDSASALVEGFGWFVLGAGALMDFPSMVFWGVMLVCIVWIIDP